MVINMGKIFFTADLHFGHENIMRFDRRPFNSVEEMNKELIKRWNNKVSKDDTVYILGDIIWKSCNDNAIDIIKALNGKKILITGNHDGFLLKNNQLVKQFEYIKDYDDICVKLEDGTPKRLILSHYFIPFYNGHRYGAIHLHGHSHVTEENNWEIEIQGAYNRHDGINLQIYNVGCMHWNYEPVTLDEILERGG